MKMEQNPSNHKLPIENVEPMVMQKIEKLKKLPIIKKAFDMLAGSQHRFKYHNIIHTDDVLHEAILFGIIDGLSEEDLEKNATAAVWHDIGFLFQPKNNETIAVKEFNKEAEKHNIKHRDDIQKMIMDTRLVMTDKGLKISMKYPVSAYLLDADVSNLGRTDFKEKSELYAQELGKNLNDKTEKLEFLESTLKLLKNHNWYTKSARDLRQEQKLKNIEALEKEIAKLKG